MRIRSILGSFGASGQKTAEIRPSMPQPEGVCERFGDGGLPRAVHSADGKADHTAIRFESKSFERIMSAPSALSFSSMFS